MNDEDRDHAELVDMIAWMLISEVTQNVDHRAERIVARITDQMAEQRRRAERLENYAAKRHE